MDQINNFLEILPKSEPVHHKKGDVLQRAGERSYNAYYVKKGLLKSYTIDKKGKEHIFMFAAENWIISDIESQEFDQLTELYIECIEDSELLVIERTKFSLNTIMSGQQDKIIGILFRRIAVLQKRIILMMSATAQQRYEYFLENYPNLPNRIPQRMIASYLGITPEALSKIRGKMARQQD